MHPKACEEKRKSFQNKMEHYEKEGKNIVYLDESGFEKDTLRHYGYAKIGTRCVDSFDWQAKGRTNVIGACLAGFCWESVFLNSMSMRMFFMAGLFSAYCPHSASSMRATCYRVRCFQF